MPYLLYVLKAGFRDAGFQLTGDILSDEHLLQRCIFTEKNYYTTGDQKLHKLSMFKEEVYLTERTPRGDMFGKWKKSVVIEAPGKYRIYFKVHNALKGADVNLYYGGKHVYSFGAGNQRQVVENLSFVLDVSEQDAVDRKEFIFEYYGYLEAPHLMDSSKKDIGLAYMEIRPMRQHTIEGNVIPYVFNFNRVNLKKAVPDMSFGDLVTIIKNWRNYDLTFDGSKAVMNLIRIDKMKEPEDFRAFEVENPIRKFTDKEYFHLKLPEVEGMENRNIFFNESGYQLNPAFVPENTTEITINGFWSSYGFFPWSKYRQGLQRKFPDAGLLCWAGQRRRQSRNKSQRTGGRRMRRAPQALVYGTGCLTSVTSGHLLQKKIKSASMISAPKFSPTTKGTG